MTTGAMTRDQREAFLAGVHIGVLAIDEPGRGPFALPIWYLYRDGVVEIGTEGTSLKARLLRAAGRATMTVQDEQPPYRYVSVEGPVEIRPATDDYLELATRYLGTEVGGRYAAANPIGKDSVVIVLRPEHWRTVDYGSTGRTDLS